MSSKTGPADAAGRNGSAAAPARRPPLSLSLRLAIAFGIAAFGLLLFTTSLLYAALADNLGREDDEYIGTQLAQLEAILQRQPIDAAALRAEVDRGARQQFYPPVYIRVTDASGLTLAEAPRMDAVLPSRLFPRPINFRAGRWRGAEFTSTEGRPFGGLAATIAPGPGAPAGTGNYVVQVALDEVQEGTLLTHYRRIAWVVLAAGLAGSALAGYAIARRGLRPIERMADAVRHVGSSTLHERVDAAGFPAELSSLAGSFNDMLRRLQESFARLARFSSDIAHELRGPIHNVRGLVDVSLSKARSADDFAELLGPCQDECDRLSRLIDNLLFLARSEHPQSQIRRQRLSLRHELETLREFYDAAAAESGVTIAVDAPPDVDADVDRMLLQRAVCNLIENALAHTPAGGRIDLCAGLDGADRVRIEVADTGAGIAAEHLPHVFDRLYRVDAARSKHTGGVGLGLAIVQGIAGLHGGTARAASTVGVGSRFTLSLPRYAPHVGDVTPMSSGCQS